MNLFLASVGGIGVAWCDVKCASTLQGLAAYFSLAHRHFIQGATHSQLMDRDDVDGKGSRTSHLGSLRRADCLLDMLAYADDRPVRHLHVHFLLHHCLALHEANDRASRPTRLVLAVFV